MISLSAEVSLTACRYHGASGGRLAALLGMVPMQRKDGHI
jgi:hypothetical protein